MALMAAASVSASAQQKQTIEIPSWLSNVKLSGYGMTQYQYNGQKDAESNSFNIRMARISLEGRIAGDFYWKTQIQFNGNTSTLGSSPRMVDLFAGSAFTKASLIFFTSIFAFFKDNHA